MDYFSKIDVSKPICLDVEGISFDDKVAALYPYKGSRVSMYGFKSIGGEPQTFSVRNRHDSTQCLPFDQFIPALREWALTVKHLYGQKIKYDLHMSAQDGVIFKNAEFIEDLMVLDRLHNYNEIEYNIEAIAGRHGCKKKKGGKEIAEYLRRAGGSQDYGIIPPDMLRRYLIGDLELEEEAFIIMTNSLPPVSENVRWTEARLTYILFEMERDGIWIDKQFLLKKKVNLLMDQCIDIKKISTASNGMINNPGSFKQKGEYFEHHKIEPVLWTKDKVTKEDKNPSWNGEALEQVSYIPAIRATCLALMDYNEHSYQEAQFCTPWAEACDENNIIHPDFRAGGTKTGRLSAGDPNVYNPPKWMMEAMRIPDGYVGIKWDKKQIEYRLFAHYTSDPGLLAEYAKDPEIDYHQKVGDRLGLPRDPTKRVNFGVIYGMGEAKTKRTLASNLVEHDSEKLRQALKGYYQRAGGNPNAIGPVGSPYDAEMIMVIATQVLKEYHASLPSIKEMFKATKEAIRAKGYVRNYFGRIYRIPANKAYVAVNALIQGSAADLFKRKLVELHKAKPPSARFIDMIYDSCFAIVKIDEAQQYWDVCQKIVCEANFKVPILIDGEVAMYNWGNIRKIKNSDPVLEAAATICSYKSK